MDGPVPNSDPCFRNRRFLIQKERAGDASSARWQVAREKTPPERASWLSQNKNGTERRDPTRNRPAGEFSRKVWPRGEFLLLRITEARGKIRLRLIAVSRNHVSFATGSSIRIVAIFPPAPSPMDDSSPVSRTDAEELRVPPEDGSITAHVRGVKSGSERSFEAIWAEYFDRLTELARYSLSPIGQQVATPDEVAGSVLRILWDGAQKNRFATVNDRRDLWRILVVLTEHKVIDKERQARAMKRGGAKGGGRARPDLLAQVPSKEPSPALIHELRDEMERLLRLLPSETLRQIALWRLEGHSVEEIARQLEVTTRTIERKLVLIRELWADEFNRVGGE